MKKLSICLLTLLLPLTIFAQQVKKVEGEYIYRASENVTVEQAKRIALERAQLEAIAETFGTVINQQNYTHVSNGGGDSSINFQSFSSSDVKGEWIETIGDPEYSISYEQGMLVVSCRVKGRIREIVSAAIDIKAKVLRNGTEDRFESSEFRSGDDLYLSFQSPVDGYLTVYLIDSDGNAFCLLPYRMQTDGVKRIEANKRYLFFSVKDAPAEERSIVDEYTMTCESGQETNQICVIFSPNAFVKANDIDNGELLPRELSDEGFQKWLTRVKKKDVNLGVQRNYIIIKPQ